MKKSVIIILFTISTIVSAQNEKYDTVTDKYGRKYLIEVDDIDTTKIKYKWLGAYHSSILEDMRIEYKKPFGFNEVDLYNSFKKYPILRYKLSTGTYGLCSDDKEFIALLSIYEIFTKKFQKEMEELFPGKSYDLEDKQHFYQIKAILKSFYGEEMEQHWREKITTYPKEEALNKFNADNAYRFSITLSPEDYYEKKFKYVDLLFLQKKGRGYVYFCCFYTDKVKAELNNYWSEIEKVFHYED